MNFSLTISIEELLLFIFKIIFIKFTMINDHIKRQKVIKYYKLIFYLIR